MPRPSKRDHLIDTAVDLFNSNGFHATGIDTILEHAGVARMTLYNHFESKDQLILAALERRDEAFRAWFVEEVTAASDKPREQLVLQFDVLRRWISGDAPGPNFSGCTFINAAAEFGDPSNPVHRAARIHKHRLRAIIAGIAEAAGARNPDSLAARLHILIEGAIVTAQVTGEIGAADHAKDVARMIIADNIAAAPQQSTA